MPINSGIKGNGKKVAVVGSGFGGLATAIRLQSAGFQVEIFEKRDQPGGRAYVFREKGFTFDAGPTVITAPECLEELFEISGRQMKDYLTMVPVHPFYRLKWEDGYVFDYSNDEEALLEQIRQKSPDDVSGYQKFLAYSKEVYTKGYVDLAAKAFLRFSSMIRVAPDLIRLSAHRSVFSVVSKFIKDPHLRQGFSFHSLLVGGNPFSTSSIYTLIHFLERKGGVHFPLGGTGSLVQGLVRLFEDLGGKLHLNAEVAEIQTAEGKVTGIRTKSGMQSSVSAVVSNGDVLRTYSDLMRTNVVAQKKARALENKDFSMSLFLIYFGTNKKFPGIAHHTVLFGPRYKELLADIFKNGKLPEDFSLYLHAPTVTDPKLAPEGCESFYVLAPVSHLGKMPLDWNQQAPIYAEKILKYLEEQYLPDLRKHIVVKKFFTPLDFESQLNSHVGAAFSLEPTLLQSAYFRVHNRDSKIGGLYFAGAGTHPGAGVPGVVNSAKATAELVIEDLS